MRSSARSRSAGRTSSFASGGGFSPGFDHFLDRIQPVGESGWAGLQDDGGLDLADEAAVHRWYGAPARARRHFVGAELLAAPGTENDVGRAPWHLRRIGDDSLTAERLG